MSLRRADSRARARHYDRGMPAPAWSGPPDRAMPGPPWGGPPDRYRRPPAAFVLLAPVIISLLVQVPAAIGIAVWTHAGWAAGLGQVALAVAGPLALLGSRRFPGPTVAVVAALALADLLFTPDPGPPYLAFAFAIVLAVARGAVAWAAASTVVGMGRGDLARLGARADVASVPHRGDDLRARGVLRHRLVRAGAPHACRRVPCRGHAPATDRGAGASACASPGSCTT